MKGPTRALAITAVALGVYFSTWRPIPAPGGSSIPSRLLGPISSLAAGWQWVRVRRALDVQRPDLAYSRAELALELDPQSTSGWAFLAAHMANDRGSPYRQVNPDLRTRWTEASIEVLRRGEKICRRPARLATQAGSTLIRVSEYEGAIPWPGGSAGALRDASEHFERATRLEPTSSEAWTLLAAHRGLWLASPVVARTPADRLAALRQGLATLDEAEAHLEDLGAVHFQRGVLLGLFADDAAEEDVELWPGGRVALYRAAVRAFEDAEAVGFPAAADARRGAEEALAALESP